MSDPTSLVHLERHGAVALIRRDNPPVNALTLELCRQFHNTLAAVATDKTVRTVVVTAAGHKSFGAGSDISEFGTLIDEGTVIEKKMAFENKTFSLIAQMPQPVIAALNGSAFGGGLEIALACDLIIAEQGQQVGFPEVKLGLFPGSGGAVRAMRRIGEARSKQMILFGDPVPVERALDWGLINDVVEPGQAVPTAMHWATRLADSSASGVQACKQAVNAALDGAGSERTIVESLELFRTTFAHPDAREGAQAFLDKRAPRFPSTAPATSH